MNIASLQSPIVESTSKLWYGISPWFSTWMIVTCMSLVAVLLHKAAVEKAGLMLLKANEKGKAWYGHSLAPILQRHKDASWVEILHLTHIIFGRTTTMFQGPEQNLRQKSTSVGGFLWVILRPPASSRRSNSGAKSWARTDEPTDLKIWLKDAEVIFWRKKYLKGLGIMKIHQFRLARSQCSCKSQFFFDWFVFCVPFELDVFCCN